MKRRGKVHYKERPFMKIPNVSYNKVGVPSTSKEDKWTRTTAAWNRHMRARPKAFNRRGGAYERAVS